MEDGKCIMTWDLLGGEHDLIAAAQHLVQALAAKKNFTDTERKLLAEIGAQLCTLAVRVEPNEVKEVPDVTYIEERLNAVEVRINNWEADQSMLWECGEEEVSLYLNCVNETLEIISSLEQQPFREGVDDSPLLRRVHDILQIAMTRLEDEFKYILSLNQIPFEPQVVSFRSSEDDICVDESLMNSFEDDSREVILKENSGRCSEEHSIDLVNPDVIPDLRLIANLMTSSNYHHECTNAYISLRKEALEECLLNLEIEKLSIEEVLKMEWGCLSSKIKRWIRAMKVFVPHYLTREKYLSEQIFGDSGPMSVSCFLESSKLSILQLLNFGGAIAIGPHEPEKLFRVLDMYEVLTDLVTEIDSLFATEDGSSVRIECHEVLERLGDCVRSTAMEFENAIATNVSTVPFAGGGIHHLTKYVMNYIRLLIDYNAILNLLLKDCQKEDVTLAQTAKAPTMKLDNETDCSLTTLPMAIYFRSVSCVLEAKLNEKSTLYKDASLQHFFMMNNIHYMAQKVMNSELRSHFGDEWIRKHNWKFQQEAINYERASWSPILALLKEDGLYHAGSKSISKTLLKERFRTFHLVFEDIYKSQTSWVISDPQLREDLRISTSLKVIQAYRAFHGRHVSEIGEKYTKYHADDLEELILDLFEASQKSLQSSHRR
uniref:Exocyst subunit Exo70 family protein n=1 Tax=Kalanchoe fedtschenkoi TaxID=63787 RepID=A0A7N0T9J5_KALFE